MKISFSASHLKHGYDMISWNQNTSRQDFSVRNAEFNYKYMNKWMNSEFEVKSPYAPHVGGYITEHTYTPISDHACKSLGHFELITFFSVRTSFRFTRAALCVIKIIKWFYLFAKKSGWYDRIKDFICLFFECYDFVRCTNGFSVFSLRFISCAICMNHEFNVLPWKIKKNNSNLVSRGNEKRILRG